MCSKHDIVSSDNLAFFFKFSTNFAIFPAIAGIKIDNFERGKDFKDGPQIAISILAFIYTVNKFADGYGRNTEIIRTMFFKFGFK